MIQMYLYPLMQSFYPEHLFQGNYQEYRGIVCKDAIAMKYNKKALQIINLTVEEFFF